MPVDVKIPELGESITEVVLSKWHKSDGDWVEKDEDLFEVESDKITTDVQALEAGVVKRNAEEGAELEVGAVVATIDPEADRPEGDAEGKKKEAKTQAAAKGSGDGEAPPREKKEQATAVKGNGAVKDRNRATSVARKLAEERGVDLDEVRGTGPSGRVTKSDVLAATDKEEKEERGKREPAPARRAARAKEDRGTRREKMTKLRQKIAERLVYAKNTTAMLTTFNEADMSAVLDIRRRYKEKFEEEHGVGLGFMGFFVKACVSALRAFPRVNAYIVEKEIEYHDFVDISIAVSTEKGLTVPVLRDADMLSFAEIERGIRDLAERARDSKLTMDDLTGGTFTITNGGVFGSLNSTPILNPPQSGILGMHAIKNRPIEDPANPGQIVLRPMMYLALSYDHRLVDGKEAVQFLVHVKECIEDPHRMMLGL